jgi:hypothetical protein
MLCMQTLWNVKTTFPDFCRVHAAMGFSLLSSLWQTVPKREQRFITRLTRDLIHAAGPGVGQFARKRVIAEQDLGDPVPFGAGQPGGDESVPLR